MNDLMLVLITPILSVALLLYLGALAYISVVAMIKAKDSISDMIHKIETKRYLQRRDLDDLR